MLHGGLTVWQLPSVSWSVSRWHTLVPQQSAVAPQPKDRSATHCKGGQRRAGAAKVSDQQHGCCCPNSSALAVRSLLSHPSPRNLVPLTCSQVPEVRASAR